VRMGKVLFGKNIYIKAMKIQDLQENFNTNIFTI
jgi:hypothetical protein